MHVWVYMTIGLGSKVRETINRGRNQRTNNHVEHPGIVGKASADVTKAPSFKSVARDKATEES